MKKYLFTLGCVVLFSGCQTAPVAQTQDYYANRDARIRLYGQNQKPTILEYVQNGKKQKINVGGQAGDAFSSLVGTVKNQGIGIAQTDMSTHLKDHNGILSKIFYKEFIIPAGTPVSISNAYIGLTNVLEEPTRTTILYEGSCTSSNLKFTPKAGKDYEVIPKHNHAACGLTLLEVDSTGSTKNIELTNKP